ncbi:MAG: BLUF domain-containing protein [Planctomycetota bacterium]
MYHLIYISNAHPLLNEYELRSMVEPCRQKNVGLDITGILFYSAGHFVQLLEGEQDIIESLYSRICLDNRHHNVRRLLSLPVEGRWFGAWSMALLNVDQRTTLEETCLVQLVREAEAAQRSHSHSALSRRLLQQFRDLIPSPQDAQRNIKS